MILTEEQKDKLNKMSAPKNESDDEDTKKCPYCQMEISSKAIICPYCRSDLKFTIREVCPKCKERNAVHTVKIKKERISAFCAGTTFSFIGAGLVLGCYAPFSYSYSKDLYEANPFLFSSNFVPVGAIAFGLILIASGIVFAILCGVKYKETKIEYWYCNSCGYEWPVKQMKSTGSKLNSKDFGND